MSKEKAKRTRKPGDWIALRRRLATWDKPELLTLVKDLYEAGAVTATLFKPVVKPERAVARSWKSIAARLWSSFIPSKARPNSGLRSRRPYFDLDGAMAC
jgi:hypothetical protein